MDNENQVTSAISEGQEQELDIKLDTETESVDVEEKLAKAEEAKRQLAARAKRAEEELKKLKSSQVKETQETKPKSFDLDEVTDLRLDGYTKDEVAFIMKNGGRKSLEGDPFVKVAIEKIREQRKAEQAIPDTNSEKSEVERKYTKEQLSKMSTEELIKILPKSSI